MSRINSPSPLGENTLFLMNYLRSSLPSDHDFYSSPKNLSRPNQIINNFNSNSSSSTRSPLSSIENLERSPAMVKVDDDVLVMDGILVSPAKHKGGGKFRSPAAISGSGGGSSKSSSSSSSSGGCGYKRPELCLAWESTGACRYGLKCQFAHGQEELPPAQTPAHNRNILELVMREPQPSKHSPSSGWTPLETMESTPPTIAAPQTSKANKASPPVQLETSPPTAPDATSVYWSPLDDGIAVTLPSAAGESLSREAVNAYIEDALYGPTQRKRLPVFADFPQN